MIHCVQEKQILPKVVIIHAMKDKLMLITHLYQSFKKSIYRVSV
jgi:hypothetical protein